jgi:guanosine-3',5'-bis(diphosphate) 3'-pyrophosphohydrolase
MNRIIEAVQFAAAKHGTQKRKGTGRPYTDHLYRVAGAVAERVNAINMMAEDLVVAALLHDTLEDTTATKEEISQKFGWQVLAYVVAMTKAKDDRPRRVRNAEYFERLKKAPVVVKILKMIDRLDNLGEIMGMEASFIKKYCTESLELLDAIGDADASLKSAIENRVSAISLSTERLGVL